MGLGCQFFEFEISRLKHFDEPQIGLDFRY